MWPGMHGVLLGLAAAGPCGDGAAVGRWMLRTSGGWYMELTGDPQGLTIDELCRG